MHEIKPVNKGTKPVLLDCSVHVFEFFCREDFVSVGVDASRAAEEGGKWGFQEEERGKIALREVVCVERNLLCCIVGY